MKTKKRELLFKWLSLWLEGKEQWKLSTSVTGLFMTQATSKR